jgi:hypothetical protein
MNMRESTCLSLGKLIVLRLINNETPFFQLHKIYEETFAAKYTK